MTRTLVQRSVITLLVVLTFVGFPSPRLGFSAEPLDQYRHYYLMPGTSPRASTF